MNEPRLAIEFETKNEYHDWKISYTKYFDINNKDGIIKAIKEENEYTRINRMYYATNYGIEIEWNKNLKINEIGYGAKFTREKDTDKYVYMKVKYGVINAVRLNDGMAYNINEEENIELVTL